MPQPRKLAPMPKVTIYTIDWCPYCSSAMALLKRKGADFNEINLSGKSHERAELALKAGGLTTVPQIWIDGRYVGGADALSKIVAQPVVANPERGRCSISPGAIG